MPIIFNILHWISGITLISLSYYCLRKASNKLGFYLCFFLFILALWSLGSAMAFNVDSLELKIGLTRMRHIGICLISISLLHLIRHFCDYRPLPPYVKISLLIIPFACVLIIISPYYELFMKNYEIKHIWGQEILIFENGPLFFLHNISSRLMILWALFLLAKAAFKQHTVQKRYSWILFFSIIIPFTVDTLAVSFFPYMRFLQIVPVFLTASAVCFCYVILKGEVLEIIPVARTLILDSISDIYISLDRNNKLIDFNACTREHLNLDDHSFGKNLSELKFNKFISHIIASIEDGKTKDQFFLNYEGHKEYFNITVEEIIGNSGILAGRIVIIKNVTEQKNYELQLTQMAEIRTKFISVMAHDLIGNVASHSLLIESLMTHPKIEEDEDLKANLVLLLDSSQNVTKFVEGLLLWSKESLEKIRLTRKQSDLYQIIDESILYLGPISMQKDINYSLNVARNTLANVDVNMIQTVIRNLISNAIKYSPTNGHIHIDAIVDSESITISISDEGPGVDEMDMNQFLSRFHMKSYKGGLGLTLCRDFIHLHKGEIKAQNKNPRGAIFTFALPVS